MVVVDGLDQNPLMLLTNRRLTRSRKSQWRIVKSYLSRWRVEETIRFIKQSYRLEDIRLLRYERLRQLGDAGPGGRVLRQRVLGKKIQVGDPGEPHPTGCKVNLRRSRVPFLRHMRKGSSSSCLAETRELHHLDPILA